ncbi:MAG: hypothetical protein ACOYBL_13625 [Lachnospiraceae bacterium]|jgi:hypothetical protein
MENLEIYNKVRSVPDKAKKAISAGRLKGMTDINPMWRIKTLTEQFGPCGIGWKYTICSQWMEPGSDGNIAAFCNITLQYKYNGEWSEPIPGTGGSSFVAKESKGLYTSDECYKQALTDAISVAAKALGIGADVYWDKDTTKYTKPEQDKNDDAVCPVCGKIQKPVKKSDGTVKTGKQVIDGCGGMCLACYKKKSGDSK